jgi:hypothetical protein
MLMTTGNGHRFAPCTDGLWRYCIDAHAIRECEQHGWATDRADPYARERAILSACKRESQQIVGPDKSKRTPGAGESGIWGPKERRADRRQPAARSIFV